MDFHAFSLMQMQRSSAPYICGTYNKTTGGECDHNTVEQDLLMPDVLETIRASILPSEEKLRKFLRELVAEQSKGERTHSKLAGLQDQLKRQKSIVQQSLDAVACAPDEEERRGLREIYKNKRTMLEDLEAQIRLCQAQSESIVGDEIVEAAIAELKNLRCKLDDVQDRAEIAGLMRSLNVRVWLNFKKIMWGARAVNKLESGTVCVGNAPDPVQQMDARAGEDSLCMANRGDWRWTFPNNIDSRMLMLAAISASVNFDRDEFFLIAAI